MTEFTDSSLLDENAKAIVKYYITCHPNNDKLKVYGVYIDWKCANGDYYKYMISTSRDNEYYEVTHDMNKGEWKLVMYHKHPVTCVFSHEDVRCMKATNLYVDLHKYKEE